MKSYVTSGTGSQQTLTGSQDEKVAIYQTLADAEADLANLKAGQIVATPDTGDENAQPVDAVTDGDMHAVTSNAVFDTYAVISASSTVITGKPISQRSVIKIMFTSAISGSDTTTAMSISYNGTSYPVKVGKNGSLANFTASEISSGTYRYLQAYTTLELAFDGTQFIIIGNPVVLSSADYTIYADGKGNEFILILDVNNAIPGENRYNIYYANSNASNIPDGNGNWVIFSTNGRAASGGGNRRLIQVAFGTNINIASAYLRCASSSNNGQSWTWGNWSRFNFS
jgi:hypothetical protein